MAAEILVRQGAKASVAMRMDQADPEQSLAQFDILVSPAPVAVRKAVCRDEMLSLDQHNAAQELCDHFRRERKAVADDHGGSVGPAIIGRDGNAVDIVQAKIINGAGQQPVTGVEKRAPIERKPGSLFHDQKSRVKRTN